MTCFEINQNTTSHFTLACDFSNLCSYEHISALLLPGTSISSKFKLDRIFSFFSLPISPRPPTPFLPSFYLSLLN